MPSIKLLKGKWTLSWILLEKWWMCFFAILGGLLKKSSISEGVGPCVLPDELGPGFTSGYPLQLVLVNVRLRVVWKHPGFYKKEFLRSGIPEKSKPPTFMASQPTPM